MPVWPTDITERRLAAQVRAARALPDDAPVVVVGIDEVGRGAIAGPVCLGAVALTVGATGVIEQLPDGVRDSKTLTPRARGRLEEPLAAAVRGWGLGWSSPQEIDDIGISAALTQAAMRALDAVQAAGIQPDVILLDGSVDVLSAALAARAAADGEDGGLAGPPLPVVQLQTKADRDCISVAAASVLAKVARDRLMEDLAQAHPEYGWERNKGYGSAQHRAALVEYGPHPQHRLSWSLPGVGAARSAQSAEPGVLWASESVTHSVNVEVPRKER